MKSTLEYHKYKEYLRAVINQAGSRGLMSRLATAAGCQRPYLSKVLQIDSEVHLTPDHMFGICEYLGLSQEESSYLTLLLERERASLPSYRKNLDARIKQMKSEYLNIKKQLGKENLVVPRMEQELYYSYWLYGALHIAVSIPELQTSQALKQRFGFSTLTLEKHLNRLASWGLVEKMATRWVWKSGDLHLSKDAQAITSHHMNWRQQAIQSASEGRADSTHYSVAQSISQNDFEKLRYKILEWIKTFQQVASPSKPEELVCFNIDLFRVGID